MSTLKYTFGMIAAAMLLLAATSQAARGQIMDDHIYSFILFDQLEYAPAPSEQPISLEATGWIGGDINRLWLRAEGEQSTLEREGETELEALYGRLITPFCAGAEMARRAAISRWASRDWRHIGSRSSLRFTSVRMATYLRI